MEDVRAHVFVEGKVQGVFYRVWTKSTAKDLNIYGWVKNLNDGRVEAMLEGKKENVEQLLSKMKSGPGMAKVDQIKTYILKPANEFDGFTIMT